jgi:hypothetical protein
MKRIIGKTFVKRIVGLAMVVGVLFAVTATSTFAQGRYYRDRQSGGEKAATIAGGAGIGAVIGSLAGGGKGALIGGLIGAGVGTGIVVHRDNQDRYGYYDNRYYNSGYYNSGYYNRYEDHDRYRSNDRYRGYDRH